MVNYNILIVEDDYSAMQVLKRILEKENLSTIAVDNVDDAMLVLKRERIDLIVSDWMMPNIDGMEFLYRLKANFTNPPPMIIVTALTSDMARDYAIKSGAVEFIEKPINIPKFIEIVKKVLEKEYSNSEQIPNAVRTKPTFIPVCIISGNGGTKPLIEILSSIDHIDDNIVIVVIQQGSTYIVDNLLAQLKETIKREIVIPYGSIKPKVGQIYFAPQDYHIFFSNNYELVIDKGPKENFQRPSAEPLFRSLANHFGKYSVAIILSGLGSDGIQGALQIKSNGGHIICQEPTTAIAPTLPKSFITPYIEPIVASPQKISEELEKLISFLSKELKNETK